MAATDVNRDDRGGLADRVGPADRRPRADRARRRPRRGPRPGGARRGAGAVARVRRPGQPGRLAHGHREAPRDRPHAPRRGARAQDARSWVASSRSRARTRDRDLAAEIDDPFDDDLLRLIFTACHPVLSTEARVALTLRLLGGLTTTEIARAFLVSGGDGRPAHRARQAHAAGARVPFEVPERGELRRRASPSVLEVIYLIFNEGYAATAGRRLDAPRAVRGGAAARAHPRRAAARASRRSHGLVALMELQASRSRARIGPAGEPIPLLEQDRARWDWLLIGRGLAALERAERARRRARPVRAAGGDRRLPRPRPRRRGHRLGADRRALRRARRSSRPRRSSSSTARSRSAWRSGPDAGARAGRRARRRAGAARLPPAARRARRPARRSSAATTRPAPSSSAPRRLRSTRANAPS